MLEFLIYLDLIINLKFVIMKKKFNWGRLIIEVITVVIAFFAGNQL